MALGDAIAGHAHFWSAGYLHQLAGLVNEVALMDYDTWIPTSPAYAGYTRMETRIALRAMPVGVHLLIGLPAYPPNPPTHDSGETVPAAITGVRLALGSGTPANVGVALYVDFAATLGDWQAYEDGWVKVLHPSSSPEALPTMPTSGLRVNRPPSTQAHRRRSPLDLLPRHRFVAVLQHRDERGADCRPAVVDRQHRGGRPYHRRTVEEPDVGHRNLLQARVRKRICGQADGHQHPWRLLPTPGS